MLKLKRVMKQFNITQAQLAKHIEYKGNSISQAVINLIVNRDIWPRSISRNQLEQQIKKALIKLDVENHYLTDIFEPDSGVENDLVNTPPPLSLTRSLNQESIYRLLRKQKISQETQTYFNIPRDPFTNEITQNIDVYLSDDIRNVRDSMRLTAKNGGMLAVIGESGSGKSVLYQDLINWINVKNEPITVIAPYILGLTDNELKENTLNSTDMSVAIIRAINPHIKPSLNPEECARQMYELLKNSAFTGRKHLLIIEEAHQLSIPMLRQLKHFYELQEGFKKLLSIILIGQLELQTKLSENNSILRELIQRCEIAQLKPLDLKIEDYIKHKFVRIDMDYTTLFDSSAFDEIINSFRIVSNNGDIKYVHSLCYPLAVNNLISNALNTATRLGAQKITREIIIECIKEYGGVNEY